MDSDLGRGCLVDLGEEMFSESLVERLSPSLALEFSVPRRPLWSNPVRVKVLCSDGSVQGFYNLTFLRVVQK